MRVCKREKKMQQSMFRSNSMKYSSMANFEYNVIRQYSPRCTDFQNIKSSASHESAWRNEFICIYHCRGPKAPWCITSLNKWSVNKQCGGKLSMYRTKTKGKAAIYEFGNLCHTPAKYYRVSICNSTSQKFVEENHVESPRPPRVAERPEKFIVRHPRRARVRRPRAAPVSRRRRQCQLKPALKPQAPPPSTNTFRRPPPPPRTPIFF